MPVIPQVPTALMDLTRRVLLDCEGLCRHWDSASAERLQPDLERLADFAANLGMNRLQEAALDLYAALGNFEDRVPSTTQLAKFTALISPLREAMPTAGSEESRQARQRVLALLPAGPMPPQARDRLEAEQFELLEVGDGDAIAAIIDSQMPAAFVTEGELVAALCETLDGLAESRPQLARVPLLAVGGGTRLQMLLAGADAWVESLEDAALPAELKTLAAGNGRDPYRVLVVDDDRQMAMYCDRVLSRAGMIVRVEGVADAVLPALREFRPDLILMDLYLPGQDGMALTSELRRHSEALVLPIVFLSGEHSELARFHAIEAGGDDFLTKPIRPRHLVAAVRSRIKRVRLLGRQVAQVEQAPGGGPMHRSAFMNALSAALSDRQGQVLMALGVDQAEELSTRLGLAARHELEQALGQRLLSALGPGDRLCLWREFGVGILLAPGARGRAAQVAEDLRATVAGQPFKIHSQDRGLTTSVGLALQPGAGADRDAWIGVAFAALGVAQRLGGNRIEGILGEDDSGLPPERLVWIRELVRRAARGSGFMVEFQPLVPLRGGGHGHYNLLLSLRDQRKPLNGLARREYLRVARELGALAGLERIALYRAIEAMDDQRSRDRSATIVVPVDLCTLEDPQLDWLERELQRRSLVDQQLGVEIDAELVLERPELIAPIERLRSLGVQVHGADRSGRLGQLQALAALPLDGLRVPLATLQSANTATVRHLLDHWHDQGRVIAVEDVDEVRTLHTLWNLGVDYLSGEAVAAPSPRLDYDFDAIQTGINVGEPG
jgi:PleD family two-component response regulator/EAL domain-containing protein (putative c-di-GMP-specific phosphodiesterase class I)